MRPPGTGASTIGVDIAADAGTEVCAAADGEVYTVYEDDSMATPWSSATTAATSPGTPA